MLTTMEPLGRGWSVLSMPGATEPTGGGWRTLLAVVVALAVGTYAFRLAGVVLRDRIELPVWLGRLLPIGAAALLAALAATAALTEAGGFAGLARPIGVLVGAVLAWRRAPFVLVIVAAAATAAVLRLLGVP